MINCRLFSNYIMRYFNFSKLYIAYYLINKIKREESTYKQYPAALFQYGFFSTQSLKFCTKSMNKQQQGASIITTKKPAIICHIPPIKQSI